jgi:hypothetical protein
MPLETPVLLVIFNRPECTRRALEAIAAVRPRTLLVAADGPRTPAEAALCERTRALVAAPGWPCEVVTDFAEKNLGCGVRVAGAVDWAFGRTERLIVLEDDCIASPSFFRFCEELLERYADDERVMHISGDNFQQGRARGPYSYYFSKITHAQGWATWKRAWRHFDWEMRTWPEVRHEGLIGGFCDDPLEVPYWTGIFDHVHAGADDIWDYRWNYACLTQNGLAALPARNLVENIGTGPDATHTVAEAPYLRVPAGEIGAIEHPPYVLRNREADLFTFDQNFGGTALRAAADPWNRRRLALRRLLRPLGAAARLLGLR